jgi:hypothetical protein
LRQVEAEVVIPEQEDRPQAYLAHIRALGFFGALLAVLTMLAAFGVGFLVLFGTTLISTAIVYAAWPFIFSPQFTQWVFGGEHVSFLKIFLLFLAVGLIVKLFRRQLWQRR